MAMKVIDFIFAARPMLFLPVWSIFLLTYHTISPAEPLPPSAFAKLISVSLMTAGIYYINQYFDYQTDLINRKLGFLQKGFISHREIIAAYLSVSILAFIISLFVEAVFALLVGIVFVFGYFYSAPPLRFKDRPVAGLLANMVGYGLALPLSLANDIITVNPRLIALAFYFSLVVGATFLLTIIPDRPGDAAARKQTAAQFISDSALLSISSALVTLAAGLMFAFEIYPLAVVTLAALALYLMTLIFRNRAFLLFSCKFPILLVSVLAGWYFPGYLVFILVLMAASRLYYKKRFGISYPRLN
ncbi:MAG: UbiA family prenyltransferase [bacterium]|jgi:4-hydroxybenzoate polyprenyltransferase